MVGSLSEHQVLSVVQSGLNFHECATRLAMTPAQLAQHPMWTTLLKGNLIVVGDGGPRLTSSGQKRCAFLSSLHPDLLEDTPEQSCLPQEPSREELRMEYVPLFKDPTREEVLEKEVCSLKEENERLRECLRAIRFLSHITP